MRLITFLLSIVFLISCALLPGHYVYETFYVAQTSEKIGDDIVWFVFEPSHTDKSKNHIIYGNPYNLDITIYSKEKAEQYIVSKPILTLASGTQIKLPEIVVEHIIDSATGEDVKGLNVYSSGEEKPEVNLNYNDNFKVDFWLKRKGADSIKSQIQFKFDHRIENRNKYISKALSG